MRQEMAKEATNARTRWFTSLLAVLVAACHAAPPPAPPPPPPPPPPVVEAPPPPPKCEAIEEHCVARADTRARIGGVDWDLAPPEGWTYAQGDEVTTAVAVGGALAVSAHDGATPKTERALRETVLRLVAERLAVTLPHKRDLLRRKPDRRQRVGNLNLELYQLDGATRQGKKGPLLVFATKVGAGQLLLGIGFVSDDDKDNSDSAILKAIGSIAARAAPSTGSP